ncbi:Autoinducer 2 sensor kinase/phosphatase luxQ [Porphyromonas crevioricanis]|uniref:histidine kinase n=1 Tax=Porphyromonas crevioricanis TaxID=393921 RepID=A0A2X4PMI2_9PORP|nr:response regulator [Porphyromonas crevioricanis]SQH72738.1 Autoinducer 2 sensor kinase/phosphatase luxQ [Porphyromonas crevioricanis]
MQHRIAQHIVFSGIFSSPLQFIAREERSFCILRSTLSIFLIFYILSIVSCEKKNSSALSSEERIAIENRVANIHETDSLASLQKRLENEGNRLGSIIALRKWGKALRNENRFDEALRVHSEGVKQAEALGDTIEWVRGLNNIGTDYRRMGVIDAAQEYHYQAWILSRESMDKSFATKKNQVVSLNGLANIYMTLGNYQQADSVLRLALAGEQQLGSVVGQAINCANLGAIFEQQGQTDSAWIYYRRSMDLNKQVGNRLGVSLCHTYFGSLYEKAHQHNEALQEYETAYELMQGSKDEWHALNPLIALAGIHSTKGNNTETLKYLSQAKAVAERINSKEHLAEIYNLYYGYYERQQDYQQALKCRNRAVTLQDSVVNIEKMNRIQNVSLNIERKYQKQQIDAAQMKLVAERETRRIGYIIFVLILSFLVIIIAMMYYIQRIRARNHRALKEMNRLRESFFTNITHELRTPLTVILGLSHNLQVDRTLSDKTREKARIIERHGNSLLVLINQLLDIAKVKSTVGSAEWRRGNISAHLAMIVETYREYARSHNIVLQFFSEEAVEMDFVPDYINKVMNNLLSNAFKFTPKYGKVNVAMRCEGKRLLIDVSDTGAGIAPDAIAHIFKPFYQAESNTPNIGSGIGLALVKQIVDAIGGSISVESCIGRGTTFHLDLPIHLNSKQQIANETERNIPLLPQEKTALDDDREKDNECRLLIVEDNRDVAAYIGSQLSDRYAISYAHNGNEGLEKALSLVPDLIISDLMMPGMDGLELCKQIRDNEIVNHIPIIVVTAKVSEEDRIKGLEAGANAYLAKPFNSEELRTLVEKLLERQKLLREKFARTIIESKDQNKESNGLQTNIDFRFLAKVSETVYLMLSSRQEVDVSLIASKLCMSNSQFYRKMTSLTGYTPMAYIQRIKIKKVCRLLDNDPEISLREAAEQCGFNDYSNFIRAFKNVYGITPSDYRKGQLSML